MMRRNCNLELRLVPPSASLHSGDYNHCHHPQPMLDLLSGSTPKQDLQQLTIFYNGRVSVCDVSELQARTIIMLASQEMEAKSNGFPSSEPSSPLLQSQLCTPIDQSMKRSLQHFLQKRKNRIQATSPYKR